MEITGYHTTDRDFEEFDDSFIGSGGHHANSALGHWFFTSDDPFDEDNERVIAAQIRAGRCHDMTIMDLHRLSTAHFEDEDGGNGFFAKMRERLLSEGYDVIRISEVDGAVSTVVALSSDRILSVEKYVLRRVPFGI